MRKIVFLLVAFIVLSASYAQETMQSSVSRDSIRIGEQFTYSVIIPARLLDTFSITKFQDSIGKFTVVQPSKIDTASDFVTVKTLITAFDSGAWTLPAYKYGTYSAQSLSVYTGTVAVDTTKPFKDIYGLEEVENPGFSYAWLWLLLLIPLIWFLYKKWKSSKTEETQKRYYVTPYEKAVNEVELLRKSEMWKNPEQVKAFYADLTDIMRTYFHDEYGIQAMESTSTELLKRIKKITKVNQRRNDIQWVLEQADLAKFAKTRPSEEVNEEAMDKVKFILKWTRPKPQTLEEAKK